MSTLTIEPLDGLEGAAEISAVAPAAPAPELPPAESTSSLERYLAEVTDPVLRENLAREIGSLQRQFGLVFERHHPEGIRLPKHKVKRGSKVVIAGRKDSVFYRVQRLHRDQSTALIVDAQGNEQIISIEELTVAKEFGDIMYPGLRKLSEVRRGAPDAPVHTIINGENYHALEVLQYTHAGKVDLIYIDPPYNTGNADWKYNDRYVDAKDGYRHSKWLSFMEKRLEIAKRLLTQCGVMILAIDDSENARLKMLCDQVMGEQNFIANVVWQGGRKNDSRYVSVGHDYMLIYAKSAESLKDSGIRWSEPKPGLADIYAAAGTAWSDAGQDPSAARDLMKAWFRSLPTGHPARAFDRYNYFDEGTGRLFRDDNMSSASGATRKYEVRHPRTGRPVYVPERGWAYTQENMARMIAEGRVYFGHDETVKIFRKTYLDETEGLVPASVFESGRVKASNYLKKLLGSNDFPFPKDVDVIARWIRLATAGRGDACVLDFFGGTGTTAEAVIRLNAEDGGTRQCILVTNNELSKADDTKLRKAGHQPGDDEYEALGVFHHVTRPRLETVVTGVREDGSKYSDGLDANVAFFALTYLDEPEILTGRALEDMAGLFWLKAGGAGSILEASPEARRDGFAVSDSGRTAVLLNPGRAGELAERLRTSGHEITHLFIVTDSAAQGDEAASHFPGGIAVERIYGNYLEAFQVNRKD